VSFNTVNEAKEYVVSVTNRAKSIEEIDSALAYYQEMADNAYNEESRSLWLNELNKLAQWKQSDDFKSGNYPLGIDELILELVEWRSAIYAFDLSPKKWTQ